MLNMIGFSSPYSQKSSAYSEDIIHKRASSYYEQDELPNEKSFSDKKKHVTKTKIARTMETRCSVFRDQTINGRSSCSFENLTLEKLPKEDINNL